MRLKWWHGVLVLTFLLVLLSPLASSWPDGLERVAEDYGFAEKAADSPYQFIPDYVVPGVRSDALATILAGMIGTLILFGIGYGLARLLRSKNEA
ncbi:MAG: hypothetical protein FJ008_00365 [Chloroflexi bacterium]|nr:hypothetical protein [Chloroflexota bacterium]MBM3173738.1 hypothetical protein [Chloroflexota bacterium]MBM3174162.1 hypothetical protein [Chloroflexota bacterium]MBM4449230.1 hypothetical protein [Chloroflexota bacterium]